MFHRPLKRDHFKPHSFKQILILVLFLRAIVTKIGITHIYWSGKYQVFIYLSVCLSVDRFWWRHSHVRCSQERWLLFAFIIHVLTCVCMCVWLSSCHRVIKLFPLVRSPRWADLCVLWCLCCCILPDPASLLGSGGSWQQTAPLHSSEWPCCTELMRPAGNNFPLCGSWKVASTL